MFASPARHGAASRGFLVTVALLLTSLIVACLAHARFVLPDGALRRLDAYEVLWPQGWAFFTPAEQDVLVAYRRLSDGRLDPVRERRLWDDRLGGLRRLDDSYEKELRALAVRIPERYWQRCGDVGYRACGFALDAGLTFHTENRAGGALLCAPVALSVERVTRDGERRLSVPPRHVHRIALVVPRC
ncbi:hypothetical protein [Actinosynnema sp. NPDC020468]|uniref:hypothetical protein n=1 Tax=Actinosynnema sp. NPDC020468 TaxID=3154488 RepID=UPI0033D2A13A